ncbi:hypothetical protein SERLA73DRAFT_68282 [Serpula lacrymans var. lacrymans S7.3]|uniref:Uncharacterized protein n=2 Tax=Serpula lacrymans var. lacrymans TaxID=341189 RepID=F8PHW3_SERL3|nr:uncharacterized protein SERLADRAFT_432025 [Serpula lacrymans var. lacrymans S7.9]EGO04592.1 hypothetical protein SERLA73DRAFT_68282 [Serpula lacrymans var. lacrymans S7.3]EGO30467.1 hypothetical protein SERLADRAFT_432025 [Serpula lacrymans var. lacrymans S7.9]
MPTPVHEVFIEHLSELLQGELSCLMRRSDRKFRLSSNTSKFLWQGQITTVPDLALKFQSLNPSTKWQDLFIVEVSHSQSLGDVTQKVKKYWEELPHLVGILVVKFYKSHKYAKPQYGYAEPVNMQYWYNLQKDDNIKYGPLRTADSITWAGRFVVDMNLYEKDPKVVGKEGYARDLPTFVVLRVVPNIDVGQLYPTQAQKDEFNKVFNRVITRSILEMEKIMRSALQTVTNLEAESAAAQIAALEVATQDLIANCTGCPLQTGTHSRTPTTTLPTPHLHPQVLPKEISPIDLSVFNIQLDFDNFLQAFQGSVADLAHRCFQDHYNAPRSHAKAARRRSPFHSEEEVGWLVQQKLGIGSSSNNVTRRK